MRRSITFALALLIVAGSAILAQSSASFDLSWHVIGGGGGESSSASYRVRGTMGQSLASPPNSSSASYGVGSGFWVLEPGASRIYLPIMLNSQ